MANPAPVEETLTLDQIADYRTDIHLSLVASFRDLPNEFVTRYAELTIQELRDLQAKHFRETDLQCALTVLAAIEAAFRVDYKVRCDSKLKDPLSRKFRELHKQYQMRVSLEDDIFNAWKEETQADKSLIGNLNAAFRYRHWLAHGRYWFPKLGRPYDFQTVFYLADITFKSLDLKSNN